MAKNIGLSRFKANTPRSRSRWAHVLLHRHCPIWITQTTNWSCKNSNIALTLLYISSSTPVLLDTLRQLSKSLSSDLQVIRVLCRLLVTLPHYSRNSNADARGPQFNGITVLIRTIQRDAKMMIPPSRLLEKFSLDIPSILRDTYLDQGEVSILWGNYESWELSLIHIWRCRRT